MILIIGNSLLEFFILMTVWGGLTPGVQILPAEIAERLGPIVLVNVVLVALFYQRYRRHYAARLAKATPNTQRLAGAYPVVPSPAAVAGASREVAHRE